MLQTSAKHPPLSQIQPSAAVLKLSRSIEIEEFLALLCDHQFLKNVSALRSNY
jgi:hypothetical protein